MKFPVGAGVLWGAKTYPEPPVLGEEPLEQGVLSSRRCLFCPPRPALHFGILVVSYQCEISINIFTLLITFKTYSFVNVPTDGKYYLTDIWNYLFNCSSLCCWEQCTGSSLHQHLHSSLFFFSFFVWKGARRAYINIIKKQEKKHLSLFSTTTRSYTLSLNSDVLKLKYHAK